MIWQSCHITGPQIFKVITRVPTRTIPKKKPAFGIFPEGKAVAQKNLVVQREVNACQQHENSDNIVKIGES